MLDFLNKKHIIISIHLKVMSFILTSLVIPQVQSSEGPDFTSILTMLSIGSTLSRLSSCTPMTTDMALGATGGVTYLGGEINKMINYDDQMLDAEGEGKNKNTQLDTLEAMKLGKNAAKNSADMAAMIQKAAAAQLLAASALALAEHLSLMAANEACETGIDAGFAALTEGHIEATTEANSIITAGESLVTLGTDEQMEGAAMIAEGSSTEPPNAGLIAKGKKLIAQGKKDVTAGNAEIARGKEYLRQSDATFIECSGSFGMAQKSFLKSASNMNTIYHSENSQTAQMVIKADLSEMLLEIHSCPGAIASNPMSAQHFVKVNPVISPPCIALKAEATKVVSGCAGLLAKIEEKNHNNSIDSNLMRKKLDKFENLIIQKTAIHSPSISNSIFDKLVNFFISSTHAFVEDILKYATNALALYGLISGETSSFADSFMATPIGRSVGFAAWSAMAFAASETNAKESKNLQQSIDKIDEIIHQFYQKNDEKINEKDFKNETLEKDKSSPVSKLISIKAPNISAPDAISSNKLESDQLSFFENDQNNICSQNSCHKLLSDKQISEDLFYSKLKDQSKKNILDTASLARNSILNTKTGKINSSISKNKIEKLSAFYDPLKSDLNLMRNDLNKKYKTDSINFNQIDHGINEILKNQVSETLKKNPKGVQELSKIFNYKFSKNSNPHYSQIKNKDLKLDFPHYKFKLKNFDHLSKKRNFILKQYKTALGKEIPLNLNKKSTNKNILLVHEFETEDIFMLISKRYFKKVPILLEISKKNLEEEIFENKIKE